MKTRITPLLLSLCMLVFSVSAYADDAIKSFTLQTIDGKTINSETLRGTPMVINIGAHW